MKTFLEPVGSEVQWHGAQTLPRSPAPALACALLWRHRQGSTATFKIHFTLVRASQAMDEWDMLE